MENTSCLPQIVNSEGEHQEKTSGECMIEPGFDCLITILDV